MSTRKRRRRRSRVVRNVRRRRRRTIRRAVRRLRRRIRRNPPRHRVRRAIRRRRRTRYAVSHVVHRMNPPSSPFGRSTLGLAGGAAGMVIVGCYVPKLAVKILPANTSVNTAHVVNDAIKLAIGFGGYKLLQRRSPMVAQGIMVGAIVSVVYDIFSMISPMNSAPAAAAAPGPLASTTATAGTGGTGGTSPQAAGTTAAGQASYLGAMKRRQRRLSAYLGRGRRMGAYLGGMRRRKLGAYLQQGQPITSLIGPVSAARRTNRAGALGNIYAGPSVFRNAWAR